LVKKRQYILIRIEPRTAEEQAIAHYKAEGFKDSQSFKDYLTMVRNRARSRYGHPEKSYDPRESGYAHIFREYLPDSVSLSVRKLDVVGVIHPEICFQACDVCHSDNLPELMRCEKCGSVLC
jgi:hypothetical protein